MKSVPVDIWAEWKKSWPKKFKKGDAVHIDKIKYDSNSGSKICCRVLGFEKKPVYFDLSWFVFKRK